MTFTEAAAVSPLAQIRDALLNVAGRDLTGSQLRALIDRSCPGFDIRAATGRTVGPGALTKLLDDHFADIVHHVGKHGGDNLYSVGGSVRRSAPDAKAAARTMGPGKDGANLWAVFVSPGLRQQMAIDRVTGRATPRPVGAQISDNETAIPSISQDEFRTIAQNFASSCPFDLKKELEDILEQPEFVFDNWVSTLKYKYPSQYHRWGLYRVQAIIELFRKRLADAEIPTDQREATVNRFVEAQSAAYRERLFARTRSALYVEPTAWEPQEMRTTAPHAVTLRTPERNASSPRKLSISTRSLAIMAINNMSITELRELSIPLGAIIDAGLFSDE